MLKNKGERLQTVAWNGLQFVVKPGETFNVLDFKIINDPKVIMQLEDRLIFKSKGSLVRIEQPENEDSKGSEGSEAGSSDISELDLDGLKKYVAENNLDIDVEKFDNEKKLRRAIVKAQSENK